MTWNISMLNASHLVWACRSSHSFLQAALSWLYKNKRICTLQRQERNWMKNLDTLVTTQPSKQEYPINHPVCCHYIHPLLTLSKVTLSLRHFADSANFCNTANTILTLQPANTPTGWLFIPCLPFKKKFSLPSNQTMSQVALIFPYCKAGNSQMSPGSLATTSKMQH